MRLSEADIFILPSGPCPAGHWLRRWGSRIGTAEFIEIDDDNGPEFEAWVGAIEHAILMATRPVVLIAHSLAVPAVVHTAQRLSDTKVRGAFLVAPPDLDNPAVPPETAPFADVPRDPLPFPSMLVASSNDPYCSVERAAEFAACWGSDFHVAGDAGRIDAASGHGPWPEGLLMFTRLMQRLKG